MASEIKPIASPFSNVSACRNCGKTDIKLSQCGKCHFEKYCGQSCQRAHWPKHKQVCQLQTERSSGDVDKDQSKFIGIGHQIHQLNNNSQTLKSKPYEKAAKVPKVPRSDREKLIWNQQALKLQDLQSKGNGFLKRKFFEQAEEAFQEQLKIANGLGHAPMIAQAYYNLGTVYNDQGKHTEAVKFLEEAAIFIKKPPLVPSKQDIHVSLNLNIHMALGKAFDRLGKYEEAEKNNQLALPFARNNFDKSSLNLHIGLAFEAQGLYLKAIDQYTIALNLIEKSNDKGIGVIFNGMASCYRKLGEHDKAIEYGEKQLSIAEKIKDKDLLGKAYMSLGNCCLLKGNSRLASDYFQRRLDLATEEEDKNGQLVAYGNLGNCYQNENPVKAIQYYKEQLKLHSETDNASELGKCYLNLGAAHNRLGQYEEGISFFSESLKNAEERGDLELQATVHNNLAVAFENISRFEQAEKHYLKSISLLSKIHSELKENVQWKITIYEKQASTYRKFERFLIKRKRIEEALEIADLRRSRALVSVLSKKMPTETLTSDPLKIHQIQELASKLKTSFAIYSLATDEDENTGVWIISPHGDIVWQPLSLANEIRNKHKISHSFPYVVSPPKMEMTEEPSFEDQFNEQLAKWYDAFIRPIELYLPKDPQQTVTIIAEEFLSMLPVAAFRDKKGKYLIEKHPISIAPSIAVLNLLSQLPKSANETSLIVGHPTTPNPHDNDLEFAEKQVMRIVAPLLNTPKDKILSKTAPTAKRVVKEAINARWIHLSCHGTLGNTIEEKPDPHSVFEGLFKLAADKDHPKGYLQAKEVAFLNLRADLVFMNACFSGRGKLQQEGTIGPVWSFLAAGARSTIGTYWGLLDTELTNQMVEVFYKHLLGKGAEKLNKAQALQKAMLQGIKKDRNNPRQWAAFFLSGLTD